MTRHLAVLCTLSLITALLVVGPGASAQSGSPTFGIRPEDPNARDIRNLRPFVEDPDGVVLPSPAPVASATFVGIQADGQQVRRPVPAAFVEPAPGSDVEFHIRNSASGLDLRLNGPCIWGPDNLPNCEPHTRVVRGFIEVTLADGGTYTSTSLGVDFKDPVLAFYNVSSPTTITVVFDEPVRLVPVFGAGGQDSPSDWRVQNNQVTRVRIGNDDCRTWGFPPGTSGCTRILDLAVPLGEDDTPFVNYNQAIVDLDDPTRTTYEDYARNFARSQSTNALDRIRPAVPSIEEVAGRVPAVAGSAPSSCTTQGLSRVVQNNPAPTLRIGNINTDHTFLVELDGTPVGNRRPVPASGPVEATLPTLSDGSYELKVVAFDPSDNRSDRPGAGPRERSDGANNPLCLTVDTVAPRPGSAARDGSDPRVIIVTLLEDVTQATAGTWTVGSGPTAQTATSVTRGNSNRVLRVAFPDPVSAAVAQISWSGTSGGRYTDEAGNAMADFTLPLTRPALPLRPLFTTPSTSTPRFTNAADYTVSGRLDPAQSPADVSRIDVTASGVAQGDQPQPATPQQDGTWRTPFRFPRDGVYRFTATASNPFGDVSPAATSEEIVFDATAPVVRLLSPPPTTGPLGLPTGQPQDHPAGEPLDVRIEVDEVNYDFATVTVSYEDPNPGDENDAPSDTVLVFRKGNGLGQPFTIPVDLPQGFVGRATVNVDATDLATNTSARVSSVINLTDTITGPVRADLVANRPGDVRIELEFAVPLVGATFPADWTADDGVRDGRASRSPLRSTVTDRVVTLTFGQPFPGLVAADRNAAPLVNYRGGVLSTLAAADGRDIIVRDRRARDLDVPGPATVTPAQVGPVRLAGPSPQGVDCSQSPTPEGCPLTVTFSGTTHPSQRPNLYTVRRVNPDSAATDPGTVVTSGVADPQGAFRFTVGVTANATSAFRVDIADPNGNAAPTGTVVTVIEDSLGPDITSLFASLKDARTVEIGATTPVAQEAQAVDLTYTVNGGAPAGIGTATVDRATGTARFRWDVPANVDVAAGGIQVIAVARDALGNVGPPATAGLGNLPELASASTGNLTSVTVTTTEPVASTQGGNAGFAIAGGPGVSATSVDGQGRITLSLNGELPTTPGLRVTYNGRGGWTAADGRPLRAGSVPLVLDAFLPVQGLAVGLACDGGLVLSWVDEGSRATAVEAYEISRNGEVVATVPAGTRIFTDPDAPTGTVTYDVVAIGADGRRSDAASVSIVNGATPVPGAQGRDAVFGGSGFPTVATVIAEGRYTAEPNITPAAGGTVLSCDGRAVLQVPPGAVGEPMFGRILQRAALPFEGFTSLTDAYQAVAVTADDHATVDRLDGYAELSVRDLGPTYQMHLPERVTGLRVGDAGATEQSPRASAETLAVQVITLGTVQVAEAGGQTLRVFGPDPAIPSDRFATAAGLSQTQHRRAGEAVLARADDYPDALSAAPLAAQVGGPVLLTRTGSLPETTLLELRRLGATAVTLVGGTAAISADVERQLVDLGFGVRRFGGESRFETAALVAGQVGSVDGEAFLATGLNFADALSASAPAAALGRPILLTPGSQLVDITLEAVRSLGLDDVRVVGGPAAVSEDVVAAVRAAGLRTTRSAGATRYETSVVLAQDMLDQDLLRSIRPIIASGDGDGITSPDALAAGPVGGRLGSYMLLVSQGRLPDEVRDLLASREDIRGIILAGGPQAISPRVRTLIDATG